MQITKGRVVICIPDLLNRPGMPHLRFRAATCDTKMIAATVGKKKTLSPAATMFFFVPTD